MLFREKSCDRRNQSISLSSGDISRMSNRRMFFKQAGAVAAVSWPGISFARELATRGITDLAPAPISAVVAETNGIVLENQELVLVITENGHAQSLIHKP